jgi:hypothetical protein
MAGRITPGSSVEQLKQEAKRWLKALRVGTPAAVARLRAALPDFRGEPVLRDIQHALARELGFAGWIALTTHPADRPTVATYEAMADRLLQAYRTGTAEAMEAHYADTWHRRAWDGMRSYILADLGIPRAAEAGFPDITLDDARRWIARDHHFRSWQELVHYLTSLPASQRSVTRSPVGAARVTDSPERFIARDWSR